jgi:MFS family permease
MLICSATLLFYVSLHLLLPTLPVYVLSLGGAESDLGLVTSMFAFASVFARPIAGKLADDGHKKGLMIAASVVFLVSTFLYCALPYIRAVIGVRALQGLGLGFYSTGASSLVADSVPEGRRGEALGHFMMAPSLAMALGPALGLFVSERFSYSALFMVSGVLAALVLMGTVFIGTHSQSGTEAARRGRPSSHRALSYSSAGARGSFINTKVVFPSIIIALGAATYGAIASFLAVYARSRAIENSGFFFTTFAMSMFITRSVAGGLSDRRGRAAVIAPGLLLVSMGMAMLGLASTRSSFFAAAAVFGTGFAVMQPTLVALTVDHVRADQRGVSLAILLAMYDVGVALGGLAGGEIAERLSLASVYVAMSGVGLAAFVIFVIGYGRYCRHPS